MFNVKNKIKVTIIIRNQVSLVSWPMSSTCNLLIEADRDLETNYYYIQSSTHTEYAGWKGVGTEWVSFMIKRNIKGFVSFSQPGSWTKVERKYICRHGVWIQIFCKWALASQDPPWHRLQRVKIGDIRTSCLWLGKAGVKESNEETLGRGPQPAQGSLLILINHTLLKQKTLSRVQNDRRWEYLLFFFFILKNRHKS